jgi:transposase
LRIPTHLTAGARRSARQRGKSDPIDALNVARAALQEGLESFPAARLDGPELDLRLLVDHRERLVRHRVELNSTLLWHLHDLWPELRLPGGALFSKKWATRIGRRLARASVRNVRTGQRDWRCPDADRRSDLWARDRCAHRGHNRASGAGTIRVAAVRESGEAFALAAEVSAPRWRFPPAPPDARAA